MMGIQGIVLVVGLGLGSMFCEDSKVISKTKAGEQVGEVVKISADSVTVKISENVGAGGKGKPPKTEMKEYTFPIDDKAKVKYVAVSGGPAAKEAPPKIEEIPAGEKVNLHFVNVKAKNSDNKIETTRTVSQIDMHPPKPAKKDDAAKKDDKSK